MVVHLSMQKSPQSDLMKDENLCKIPAKGIIFSKVGGLHYDKI